jgi:hypothetical protein
MLRNFKKRTPLFIGAAFIMLQLATGEKVVLYRGAKCDDSFKYWAVEDTSILKSEPKSNYGRHSLLLGGPERTILIKFADLERAIGKNKKILSAKLILTADSEANANLKNASRMLVSWGEGSGYRGFYFHKPFAQQVAEASKQNTESESKEKAADEQAPTTHVVSGATWHHRHQGNLDLKWSASGAFGTEDSETLSGVRLVHNKREYIISGLEKQVQHMVDHRHRNHGLALCFDQNVEFLSSDAEFGRPRLELEVESDHTEKKQELAILNIESSWNRSHEWPKDGESITYTAHLKNFSAHKVDLSHAKATWYYRDRKAKEVRLATALEPGNTEVLSISVPFKRHLNNSTLEPIRFVVELPHQQSLAAEIDQNAIPLVVNLSQPAYQKIDQAARKKGYHGVYDWLQASIMFWNETLMPQSRFSFAPEGCTQRIRLQAIQKGENQKGQGVWGVWNIQDDEKFISNLFESKTALRETLFAMSQAMGLPDLSQLSSSELSQSSDNKNVEVIAHDRNPGLMKGGDTRDERTVAQSVSLDYRPTKTPSSILDDAHSTDLFSATSVALLENGLGQTQNLLAGFKQLSPDLVFIKALDPFGQPIADAQLEFYQKVDPQSNQLKLLFSEKTDKLGLAILSAQNQPAKGEKKEYFGDLNSALHKGVIYVCKKGKSYQDWAVLKVWHLTDAFVRGSRRAAIIPVEFSRSAAPVEEGKNLALNRIITDSKNSMPAKLATLVSDHSKGEVAFEAKAGDWIEIDLGRDRPIGRVSLDVLDKQIWPKFSVMLYQTGQKPEHAVSWTSEQNGIEAARQGKAHSQNERLCTLDYHAPAFTARYVRIAVTGVDMQTAKLANIRIYPAVLGGDN